MRSNNKRDEILQAALRVVEDQGVNRLTIDAVAAESGFSKGGVLYHFASKKALLAGMTKYQVELYRSRIDAYRLDNRGAGTLAAALHSRDSMTPGDRQALMALLAGVAEDPGLLSPARELMTELYEKTVGENADADEATLLFLANEGLRFLDLLGLNPLTEKRTADIGKYLRQKAGAD